MTTQYQLLDVLIGARSEIPQVILGCFIILDKLTRTMLLHVV
jgi:hypothetical protein